MGRLAIDPRDLIAPADYRAIRHRLRRYEKPEAKMIAFVPPPAPVAATTQVEPVAVEPEPVVDLSALYFAQAKALAGEYRLNDGAFMERLKRRDLCAAIAADIAGVTREDVLSTTRRIMPVTARQATMWVTWRWSGASTVQCGLLFKRDHSTLIHAFRKIDAALKRAGVRLDPDATIYEATETIINALLHRGWR